MGGPEAGPWNLKRQFLAHSGLADVQLPPMPEQHRAGDGCAWLVVGLGGLLGLASLIAAIFVEDRWTFAAYGIALLAGFIFFTGVKFFTGWPGLAVLAAGLVLTGFLFQGLLVIGPNGSYWQCYFGQKSSGPGVDNVTADLRCR